MTETTETRHLPVARSDGLQDFARMGQWLAALESQSKAPEAVGAAAALRLVIADSLGLPLTAAAEVHAIKGKLSLGYTLLRALAEQQGYTVKRVDSSDTACTAVVFKDGQEVGRTTWTIEKAQRRKLVKSDGNWVTMPDTMLWARACTDALREHAPSVMVGLYATEELEELTAEPVSEEWEQPAPTPAPTPEPESSSAEPEPASSAFTPPEGPRGGGGEEPEEEPGLPGGWDPADPAHPDAPWDSRRRGHIFALLNELTREGFKPEAPWANWKTVAEASASKHYGHGLEHLTNREADDLIERIQRVQSQLQAQAGAPEEAAADSDADDIPF